MIVIDENGNATAVADSRGDDSVAIRIIIFLLIFSTFH